MPRASLSEIFIAMMRVGELMLDGLVIVLVNLLLQTGSSVCMIAIAKHSMFGRPAYKIVINLAQCLMPTESFTSKQDTKPIGYKYISGAGTARY